VEVFVNDFYIQTNKVTVLRALNYPIYQNDHKKINLASFLRVWWQLKWLVPCLVYFLWLSNHQFLKIATFWKLTIYLGVNENKATFVDPQLKLNSQHCPKQYS
jgi:hypothetical protein